MENHPNNHHTNKHFSPVSFIAGLLIALVVFFVLFKTFAPKTIVQKSDTVTETTKTKTVAQTPMKDSIDFSEEHFHKLHHHKHMDKDVEDIIVSPDEMSALEKGNLSEQQKKLLELLPNAPVIYIFDLKVTDYKNLYFTDNGPLTLYGKGPAAGQVLHDGLKAFSEKKFTACVLKMRELLMANPGDVNALFYDGMAAYYAKEYEVAIERFEKVEAAQNNCFKQEATWFKAMALFTTGKREEAEKLLQEIADTKGFYSRRASGLLAQL